MKNQQIVFVETQGRFLTRLRSDLMGSRPDWQILLVVDASTALDLIAQRKISIVLASFGDDRSSCEDFFYALKDQAPEIIRMGLLMEQTKDNLIKSLEYAHECISAHCSTSQIEVLITRGLLVWDRVRKNRRLADLLSNLQKIPTPPSLYFDIRDELDSPTGSARSVAQIIAKDPALTAKLLKVANSGFYATPRTVADLYEAITLLGMDLVQALVIAAHLYDQLPIPGLNLDELWKHSIAVASLAKEIAAEEGANRAITSTCAISGLLHDIGELVFLANMPDPYFSMVRRSGGDEKALLKMELEQFGVGHPELGALILSLWGLPEDVVQAIAYHHVGNLTSLSEVPLPSRAVCIAEFLLQTHNLDDDLSLTGSCLKADLASAENPMAHWMAVLNRLMEQGSIQPPHNPVDALFD